MGFTCGFLPSWDSGVKTRQILGRRSSPSCEDVLKIHSFQLSFGSFLPDAKWDCGDFVCRWERICIDWHFRWILQRTSCQEYSVYNVVFRSGAENKGCGWIESIGGGGRYSHFKKEMDVFPRRCSTRVKPPSLPKRQMLIGGRKMGPFVARCVVQSWPGPKNVSIFNTGSNSLFLFFVLWSFLFTTDFSYVVSDGGLDHHHPFSTALRRPRSWRVSRWPEITASMTTGLSGVGICV